MKMSGINMNSLLTRQRPDIWLGGLALATSLTGYVYLPKLPVEGRIWACGGYVDHTDTREERIQKLRNSIGTGSLKDKKNDPWWIGQVEKWRRELKELGVEDAPPTPEEIERARVEEVKKEIADIDAGIKREEDSNDVTRRIRDGAERRIKEGEERIEDLRRKRKEKDAELPAVTTAPMVYVPEGAMEWLLHEVGHFVAASAPERQARNYGLGESERGEDGEREWQAWAFEDIILAPHGPARNFAPVTQRDGAAFARSGLIPDVHYRHIEKQILDLGLDVDQWRCEYGQWVRWGAAMGAAAPWHSVH
jgi:hypothetical protein